MEAKYAKLTIIEKAAQAGVRKQVFKSFCHVCKTDPYLKTGTSVTKAYCVPSFHGTEQCYKVRT